MRIAYVCRWNAFAADGVCAKIGAQVRAWRERGHDVDVFCLSPAGEGAAALEGELFLWRTPWEAMAATRRLRRAVNERRPDVVYLRYGLFAPSLGPLVRRSRSAVEVQTDDRAEARQLRGPAGRAYNELNRRALLGGAAGLVCVTHELARANARWGTPVEVVTNGIDLDGVPIAARRDRERPLAAFLLGLPMPWHGLDKLLALARAVPDWDFAVIGVAPAGLPRDAPANVFGHPRMGRDRYAQLLADADVGIGSLALHRTGLTEASPLKVREYLAHGLPIVIGYEDTDFIGRDPWFVLRLPGTEDNVAGGAHDIRAFLDRVRGRRVARADVEPLIGSGPKEDARLAFLGSLAGR